MNKETKEICKNCEKNLHLQGKGCAFRSLGNEYCDEVENVNNLINDLQQRIDKSINYIKKQKKKMYKNKNKIALYNLTEIQKILVKN